MYLVLSALPCHCLGSPPMWRNTKYRKLEVQVARCFLGPSTLLDNIWEIAHSGGPHLWFLLVSAWCWPVSWVVPSSHALYRVAMPQICGKVFSGAAVTGIGYQLLSHPTLTCLDRLVVRVVDCQPKGPRFDSPAWHRFETSGRVRNFEGVFGRRLNCAANNTLAKDLATVSSWLSNMRDRQYNKCIEARLYRVWRVTLSSPWLTSSTGIKPEKISHIFSSSTTAK